MKDHSDPSEKLAYQNLINELFIPDFNIDAGDAFIHLETDDISNKF